jgi:uncharacterized protein (TIGR03790 family)
MRHKVKIGIISTFLLLLFFSSPSAQDKMYKIVHYDTIGNIQNVTYRESILDQPENVLVVYNINYQVDENDNNIWDGYEIAAYYQEKRNIPSTNIVGIRAPVTPEISRAQYDSYYDHEGAELGIRQQIENVLNSERDLNGILLRGKIKYIVLTKGIPHRIRALNSTEYFSADYASVDASIAMVFNGNYDITWHVRNPYYYGYLLMSDDSPFIPEYYTNHLGLKLSYLVTRLDGYTVGDVLAMIDRGVAADSLDRYKTFVIDDAQKTYDGMSDAYNRLKTAGATVFPDPWEDSPLPIFSIPDSVTGIVTHGVHAGMSEDYILNQYDFQLGNGSIFSSYESINGGSFSENVRLGQGQISDFIRIGGSGGVGNVYEPYSSNIADEWILFPAYFTGYTFAEAAYMSIWNIDWTAVVVGDPLMRIGPKIQPGDVPAFRIYDQMPKLYTVNHSRTTVAQITFSEEIDTLKLPVFYYHPDDLELETYADKNYLYLWSKEPLPENETIVYLTDGKIYSVGGDSISGQNYAYFQTHAADIQPVAPMVYQAKPGGIDADQEDDLIVFFSQQMQPETIFPLLGNNDFDQVHTWMDGRILRVSHPPFLPATFYSFYIDEHAKSVDDMGLEQNFYFNFKTNSNYIAYDIDDDGQEEYASNQNQSILDGYEVYVDTLGHATSLLYTCDLNSDNQPEFLISRQSDNYPSYFWDPGAVPYTGYLAKCFAVDDDEDGVLEYAFDDNGSGYYTKVYDPNGAERIRNINFILYKQYPKHLSQNVSVTTTLQLEFTVPVKYDLVSTFISGDPVIEFKSIQTELNGRKIIIQLTDPLREYTEYRITVKAGLSSIKDDLLAHDYEYVFQTGGQQIEEAPRVISFYPGDSLYVVDNTPTVRFIFSLPMDTTIIQPVIIDTTSGVSWAPVWVNSRTLYFLPLEELRESENYSFMLSANLKSKGGVFLDGKRSFNFTSGDKNNDLNNPFILQVIPVSNSSIRGYQSVYIIFSEWMINNPEDWLQVQSSDHYQDFLWERTGRNLYRLTGNPSWQLQSKLYLDIEAVAARDNNLNHLIQDYEFEYYVFGEIVRRDVDNDGICEYVMDGNASLLDGLEMYVDPGGIQTQALFAGDIDNDGFYDFLVSDPTGAVLLTWYPSRSDSGIIGFTEQISDTIYEMSIDNDNLVEYRVLINSGVVQQAIPRIRIHNPQNAADKIPPFTSLEIEFNTQMDPFSVVQNTNIIPSISGSWGLNESNSKFTYTPLSGWNTSTIYSVRIDAEYQALNGQSGVDSSQFSFRIADSLNQPGEISWQFPQIGDSAHSQSIYYFGFTEKADTSVVPSFFAIQNFKTYNLEAVWISDTVLSITCPVKLQEGETVLRGQGQIKFLSTLSLEFNSTSSFIVFDNLKLQLIKSLTGNLQELAVGHKFPFIFNQPLDSLSFDQISFSEINDTTGLPISFSTELNKNYLTVRPSGLNYNTDYVLKLDKMLKGISNNMLGEDHNYYFRTEGRFNISNRILNWQQESNFLIITWPIPLTSRNTFKLYVCEDFRSGPDTVTFKNLYNISQNPSWLLDLNTLPERFYVFVNLTKSDRTYWAKPSLVDRVLVKENELVSFPVLQKMVIDSLHLVQSNFLTVSQWDAFDSGWNSAKYLKESEKWIASFVADPNRGILSKVDVGSQIGWMQSIPDTFRMEEPVFPTPRFRSVCNPYHDITASQLSAYFGQASRLAVWDNDRQGWNEAVFDTISSAWINDFAVGFMTPVYVCTAEKFTVVMNPGNFGKINLSDTEKPSLSDDHLFPSVTRLIYLPGEAVRMVIFKNNERHEEIAGCGIDPNFNVAFINLGNLDKSDHWEFQYYDKNDRLLHVYDLSSENEKTEHVPETFSVGFPYPNPFNSSVTVLIKIPTAGKLNVTIYNILGQLIHSEENKITQPQEYKYRWDSNVATGIYFLQIKFGRYLINRKLMLIK